MNKNVLKACAGLSLIVATASCGSKAGSSASEAAAVAALGDMPVVAERVEMPGGGELIVAHPEKSGERKTLKLSDLATDIRMVRLENTDEALIGAGQTWITGERIIVYSEGVVKQFDFDGKYLGQIGARGNGPGEYSIAPYDFYVDADAGRIYMVQYGATKLMSYNSDGTFAGDIPLAREMPKGAVRVDTERRRITAVSMCFEGSKSRDEVWEQDFDGNLLSSVSMPWLEVPMDYSNEVMSNIGSHPEGFSYSVLRFVPRADSLYQYDGSRLRPVFTASVKENVMHGYDRLGSMYMFVSYGEPEEVEENSYVVPANTPMLVDPATLRGGYCNLMIDCIGELRWDSGWIYTKSPDYFIMNTSPGAISSWIDKSVEKYGIEGDALTKLRDFQSTLSEDDNNIVVFGRWK